MRFHRLRRLWTPARWGIPLLVASGLFSTRLASQQIPVPELRPVTPEPAAVVPTVRSFVQELPIHAGVDAELARYEEGGLPPEYRADFARVARSRILDRVARLVGDVLAGDCRRSTGAWFPGKHFSGLPGGDGTREGFENSLVLSQMVACFPGAADPDRVLEIYASPEVRMAAQSRLEEVFQRDGLTCYRVGGIPVLLSASLACNEVHRLSGSIAAEHSQSVASEADGKQPVYFKESLKVAFPVDGGVALVHLNLSRTTGLNGIEKRIGRGAIEDTLKRQAELVAEALATNGHGRSGPD